MKKQSLSSVTLLILFASLLVACGGGNTTQTNGTQSSHNTRTNSPTNKKIPANQPCQPSDTCEAPAICLHGVCTVPPAPDVEEKCSKHSDCQMGEECIGSKCVDKSQFCSAKQISCKNDNYRCVDGICEPTCAPQDFCGGGCCATGETCFENKCIRVEKPAGKENSTVLCKTTDGMTPTWCDPDQGCFKTEDSAHPYACVSLGNTCNEETEEFCQIKQYCDSEYKKCVDFQSNKGLCVIQTPFDPKEPEALITWKKNSPSEFSQIMSAPIVGNIYDDNKDGVLDEKDTSEIVFVAYNNQRIGAEPNYETPGVLYVLSGRPDPTQPGNAKELWNSQSLPEKDRFYTSSTVSPAIGDVTGDGKPNIVVDAFERRDYKNSKRYLMILNGDGTVALKKDISDLFSGLGRSEGVQTHWNPVYQFSYHSGWIIADLDGDSHPELIADTFVFNNKGEHKCTLYKEEGTKKLGYLATNTADFDNDGRQEIVAGSAIFKYNEDGTCTLMSDTGNTVYATGIADITGDGRPEIVSAADGKVYIDTVDPTTLERKTQTILKIPINIERIKKNHSVDCTLPNNASNKFCNPGGGTPNIADFDGDGKPEIGIAGRWYYVVFDPETKNIMWAHPTIDYSSAVTSSSVFDFNGDGKAEVVYNDEHHMYIFSGEGLGKDTDNDGINDTKVLLKIPNSTATLREYPVIADVNNDGHANIVLIANNSWVGAQRGVRVFAAHDNNWVPTRRIWNQFAYRVTNVNKDGTIPRQEKPNWKQPWLNNHLQNVQKGNPFLAANVTPVVKAISSPSCESTSASKNIIFDIKNIGSREVRPETTTYEVVATQGTKTHTITTGVNKTIIEPGSAETIVLNDITLPSDWAGVPYSIEFKLNGTGTLKECDLTNNTVQVDNIEADASDLVVTTLTADASDCQTNSKIKIHYTVSNRGRLSVAAGTTKISLYGGLAGHLEPIETLTINEEIPASGTHSGEYLWDVSELLNQSLEFKVVVDEANEVVECNEENNTFVTSDRTSCMLLG